MGKTFRCDRVDNLGNEIGTVTIAKDKVCMLERFDVRSTENVDNRYTDYTLIVLSGGSFVSVKGSMTYWEQIIFS